MVTRDHQDLGSSVVPLGDLGAAHHFQSHNPEADRTRHSRDDVATVAISWPNYHSGRNGDFQTIDVVEPVHELLVDAERSRVIRRLPAHPHEGAVSVPPVAAGRARVIATGVSKVSGRPFNLAVAFERTEAGAGRAVAQSTFHHFCDYNWDPGAGCPSFVGEPPGDGIRREPDALADVHAYTANLARWL
jgi:hypothetical protein